MLDVYSIRIKDACDVQLLKPAHSEIHSVPYVLILQKAKAKSLQVKSCCTTSPVIHKLLQASIKA